MARSVYKICSCKASSKVKCRHPWWFSFKPRGGTLRVRKSLDVVLEKHIDSKTIAEEEAERLRRGIGDRTLPPRTCELLGLPPAAAAPALPTLTVRQLLDVYRERHIARSATVDNQVYQIGTINRTVLPRVTGSSAALGDWPIADVTADTLERFREARAVRDVHTTDSGSNRVGGLVAANRDLRLLRAAFNWGIRVGYVERSPFKRGTESTVRLLPEAARSRRLQAGEEEALLPHCGVHLRAVVEAALETGCRRGELLSLQWSQVQLQPRPELWLPAGKTKTGRARRVPLSTRLQTILELRRDALRAKLELQADEDLTGALYVFGNELGERVSSIKTAWRLTCQRAKIDGLHFHDLRREAGSRWMEAGVPLATIQRWLGHTNIAQTSTYLATTTAGEHEAMRRFEERRAERLTPIDTAGETAPHTASPAGTGGNSASLRDTTKH